MDSRFSFAPTEIERFVRPRPGTLHEIDIPVAEDIWQTNKADFERRLELRDVLLNAVHAGHLALHHSAGRFERGDDELSPAGSAWETLSRRYQDDERKSALEGLHAEFLARSTSHAPSLRKKSSRVPSALALADYIDPVSKKAWLGTSESWSCPCCQRAKSEVIRISASGKLTGGIRVRDELVEERDADEIRRRVQLLPNFTNRHFLRSTEQVQVCADCAQVAIQISQRFRELGDCWIPFPDVTTFIEIAPHNAHEIDWERGRDLAIQHAGLAAARPAAVALRTKAVDFWRRAEFPYYPTRAEVVSDLARDLELYHAIFDHTLQQDFIDWLVHHPIRDQHSV